jgi:hypothetical protein
MVGCCPVNCVYQFFSSFSFERTIPPVAVLELIASIWIAVAIHKIGRRVARGEAQGDEVIQVLKTIIAILDEVQELVELLPTNQEGQRRIARKLTLVLQNIDTLRLSREFVEKPISEADFSELKEACIRHETLTSDLAQGSSSTPDKKNEQRESYSTLITICNRLRFVLLRSR